MKTDFSAKIMYLLTFLNLSLFSVAGSHDGNRSGATISMPSYEEPVSFILYLVLPGALAFFAIQQPLERKLDGRWHRDEPARKYSSIVAGLTTLFLAISPIFHSFSVLNSFVYTGFLGLAALIALTGYKWDEVSEKLPI